MKAVMTFFFAALFLFVTGSWCLSGEPLKNKSIAVLKPGVGIGNIKIGDTLNDVIKKMGRRPSDGKTVQTGNRIEYWLNYADLGITYIFNEKKVLTRIAVTNPGITIQAKGIRTESTVGALDRVYGKGMTRDLSPKYEQRTYGREGVNFIINKELNKIETITVEPRK